MFILPGGSVISMHVDSVTVTVGVMLIELVFSFNC